MMVRTNTASLFGLQGKMVQVEVDLTRGFPGYCVVGLAGTTIRESGYRVRSAIVNSGYSYPPGRITINLSPAEVRKEGSHFDLPIAVGLLAAMGEIPMDALQEIAFFGELSLDGKLSAVKGALPLVLTAAESGIKKVVLSIGNIEEVSLAEKIDIFPAGTLEDVVRFLKGECPLPNEDIEGRNKDAICSFAEDYADVRGQESAKRALVISAAGGHGIWMKGSPGGGKTMMARRLPSILPPMNYEEQVEVTNIYSVAGLLSEDVPFITQRPFRCPHHTATIPGLLGGGRIPRPGEFSLAHRGVLFLDEMAQFESRVLDALRQPLEDERVVVARQGGAAIFPGKVILVAASNPCKCGYGEDPNGRCTCSGSEIARYRAKLSAPFLDRIDLHVSVGRRPLDNDGNFRTMSSADMRELVLGARELQDRRYEDSRKALLLNGQLQPKELLRYCPMTREGELLLREAYDSLSLTMRTYHKTLMIARTIADIEGVGGTIQAEHIAEALQYRGKKNENNGDL